jgi:LacI family transcriptional regulator
MPRLRIPKYQEIAQEIETRIKAGTLAEGRIASLRHIALEHGVSIVTAARALRVLGQRGLVRTVERSGCFITPARESRTEHWALCQRVTPGPWQRVAASLFEHSFEQIARQERVVLSTDVLDLGELQSERDLQRQVRKAVEAGVEGVFFLPARASAADMRQDEAFLRICHVAELPVILLERNLRGTGRPLERDLVASDDVEGGLCCTRHLLAIGRRRIAFITGSPCSSHDGRVAGYLHALHEAAASRAAGWGPVVLEQSADPSDKQTYRDLADRLLALGAEGVVCYEDYTAMGLILELLTRGVRVPADLAVVGFDNLPIGQSFTIGVTTYALALEDIAQQAFQVMRARIAHPGQRPIKLLVPGALIVRESTVEPSDRRPAAKHTGKG